MPGCVGNGEKGSGNERFAESPAASTDRKESTIGHFLIDTTDVALVPGWRC